MFLQVNTLITERDSMASHNLTLANTTSRLMAASASTTAQHDATGAGTTPFAGGDTWPSADSLGHGLFDSGFSVGRRSASAPGAPARNPGAGSQQASQGQGGAQAQHHGAHSAYTATSGAVMSPSQAREIGALLTRLTNENTQFLKARDAAVASRNEALNRAAAVEAELELRQQEFRCVPLHLPLFCSKSRSSCHTLGFCLLYGLCVSQQMR
jgi:hypothetical protein